MKKLLFIFTLFITFSSFSQFINLPVERAVLMRANDYIGNENHAVVPDGKIWQLVASTATGSAGVSMAWWFVEDPNGTSTYPRYINGNVVLSEGWKIYYQEGQDTDSNYALNFIEYNLNNQGLSFNSPNSDNKIILFPNPTTSKVALNSDKQYEIEVYDMLGNKVMELTGNTIDMSNLSSATYIIKAFDNIEQEQLSYKVIKN